MELYGGPSWSALRVTILIILVHQSGKGYSYEAPFTGLVGVEKSDSILTSLGCSKMHGLLSDSSRVCWATALLSRLPCPCLPYQLGSLSLWQAARFLYTQPFPIPLDQPPPISPPPPPKKNSLAMPTHNFYKENSVVKIDHIRYKAFSKQ